MIARTLSKKKLQRNKQAFAKLETLVQTVQTSFRNQGVAIPFPVEHGISLDNYYINRDTDHIYSIYDSLDRLIVDGINLAQTAILIANDLSVGRMINKSLLTQDEKYGYLLFEQQICKRAIQNSKKSGDMDKQELMTLRYETARQKAQAIRDAIAVQYKKLQSKINNLNTSGIKHEYQ